MDYQLLKNAELTNKKSMSYEPTWQEAGVPESLIRKLETEWEDPIKNAKNEKELDYYMNKAKDEHRNKLKFIEKVGAAKKELRLSSHWYNTLQPKEIENLVERSRLVVDQVFDELRGRVKSSWELNYIEELRLRVKTGKIAITPATNAKLKRFPAYNMGTNELHGSVYTFYRLWAHIFKSYKRAGRVIVKG